VADVGISPVNAVPPFVTFTTNQSESIEINLANVLYLHHRTVCCQLFALQLQAVRRVSSFAQQTVRAVKSDNFWIRT
jgi:hypothetical protein